MSIVAYVPDLMDRSRVLAAAEGVRFVAAPEDLLTQTSPEDVVIVDLDRPRGIEIAGQLKVERVIGFLRHDDRDGIAKAKAAGIQQVEVRSRFFPQIDKILSQGRS